MRGELAVRSGAARDGVRMLGRTKKISGQDRPRERLDTRVRIVIWALALPKEKSLVVEGHLSIGTQVVLLF